MHLPYHARSAALAISVSLGCGGEARESARSPSEADAAPARAYDGGESGSGELQDAGMDGLDHDAETASEADVGPTAARDAASAEATLDGAMPQEAGSELDAGRSCRPAPEARFKANQSATFRASLMALGGSDVQALIATPHTVELLQGETGRPFDPPRLTISGQNTGQFTFQGLPLGVPLSLLVHGQGPADSTASTYDAVLLNFTTLEDGAWLPMLGKTGTANVAATLAGFSARPDRAALAGRVFYTRNGRALGSVGCAKVFLDDGGHPAEDAAQRYYAPSGLVTTLSAQAQTLRSGGFYFGNLTPGRHRLSVSLDDGCSFIASEAFFVPFARAEATSLTKQVLLQFNLGIEGDDPTPASCPRDVPPTTLNPRTDAGMGADASTPQDAGLADAGNCRALSNVPAQEWPQWKISNSTLDVSRGAPNPAQFVVGPEGTVTDTVTGLSWEARATRNSPWSFAKSDCEALTLGGHCDWRLPTWIELVSILDYGEAGPALDTRYFVEGWSSTFWSSTPVLGSPTARWAVNTDDGTVSTVNQDTGMFSRCVRSVRNPNPERFLTRNGTVQDVNTQLTWQQQASTSSYAWAAAKSYCAALDLGGTGWRLPTVKELLSIADVRSANPALDLSAFPLPPVGVSFWSATSMAGWPVDMFPWRVEYEPEIDVRNALPTDLHHVRCVR